MNKQYFSKEQIKAGEMQKFLDFLVSESYGVSEYYNDIHICPSEDGFDVEWRQVYKDYKDEIGEFRFISSDEYIYKEYILPDNTYVQLPEDYDFNEYLEEWLEENPGWVKTSYGTWTNEIENKRFREEMEKHTKKVSDTTVQDLPINKANDENKSDPLIYTEDEADWR